MLPWPYRRTRPHTKTSISVLLCSTYHRTWPKTCQTLKFVPLRWPRSISPPNNNMWLLSWLSSDKVQHELRWPCPWCSKHWCDHTAYHSLPGERSDLRGRVVGAASSTLLLSRFRVSFSYFLIFFFINISINISIIVNIDVKIDINNDINVNVGWYNTTSALNPSTMPPSRSSSG